MSTGLQLCVSSSFRIHGNSAHRDQRKGPWGPMFTQWEEYGTSLSGPLS